MDPWEGHRATIHQLYFIEGKTLQEVQALLSQPPHHFDAQPWEWEKRLKDWGFSKNLKKNDWRTIDYHISKREGQGKLSSVRHRGKPMKPSKVRKNTLRNRHSFTPTQPIMSPRLPAGITIRTPSPIHPNSPGFAEVSNTFLSESITEVLQHHRVYPNSPDRPLSTITPLDDNGQLMSGFIDESLLESYSEQFDFNSIETIAATESHFQLPDMILDGSLNNSPFENYNFSALPSNSSTTPVLDELWINPTVTAQRNPMLLHNLPWFRFQSIIEINPLINYGSPSLSSNHNLHDWKLRDRRQIISALASSELPSDEYTVTQKLSSIFGHIIPERFNGEVKQKLQQLFSPSGNTYIAHFAELALALTSNNAMSQECTQRFIDVIMKYNSKEILRRLLTVNTPTVQAALRKVLESIIQKGDISNLDILLDAGMDRSNLAGSKGAQLLQIALGARKVEVAKVLLQNGADVNPYLRQDDPFDVPPLHHAVEINEPEMVRLLLDAGAQVDRFVNEFEGTALTRAVQYKKAECVSLLLEAGATVETCKVLDDRWDMASYQNASDYAYLTSSWQVYDLLLPYDSMAKISVSIHGVLCTAREGVQELAAYLNDTSRVDNRNQKKILEKALLDAYFYSNHEEAIDALLEFGVDPNVPTYQYQDEFPLIYAMSTSDPLSHADCLLDAGANINEPKVIEAAASDADHLSFLNFLIERGVNLDLLGIDALMSAIENDNLDAVKLLLLFGVDLNKRNSRDLFPIQKAAECASRKTVEYMLQRGADPNAPPVGRDGYTALHFAAKRRNLEILKLLIDSGAKIIQPGSRVKVSLLEACLNGATYEARSSGQWSEVIRFLLKAGMDINPPQIGTRRLRRTAVLALLIQKVEDHELIYIALDAGADVNLPGGGKRFTPIQAAAEKGNLDLVKALCTRRADINAPAAFRYGRTALQAACSQNEINMGLIRFLLAKGADLNAKAGVEGGLTALQGAAIQGHISLVLLLLDLGADVNALPAIRDGRTALEGATEHGRLDMVQLLLNAGAKCEAGGYDGAIELAKANGHWAIVDLLTQFRDSSLLGV